MLKLKLTSAMIAALFLSANTVYAAGGAVALTDSSGLSADLLPANTHATAPVGFPSSGQAKAREVRFAVSFGYSMQKNISCLISVFVVTACPLPTNSPIS